MHSLFVNVFATVHTKSETMTFATADAYTMPNTTKVALHVLLHLLVLAAYVVAVAYAVLSVLCLNFPMQLLLILLLALVLLLLQVGLPLCILLRW